MSVKVANKRFISFSFSLQNYAALYQHIFRNLSDVQILADRLIQQADVAHSFRQVSRMEELGIMLSSIPVKEYQLVGQYYTSWAQCLQGESPEQTLEEIVEYSQTYKAKALVSLADIKARQGNFTEELFYFNEALKCASTYGTRVEALRGIAIVKAKEGFSKQAFKDLEQMLPVARLGDMRTYHDYLNSLAVESLEAGRIQEAGNISRIVLASPYAFAYPEWRETGNDIALRGYKSRSVLSFNQRIAKPDDALKPTPPDVSFLPKPDRSRVHAAYWTDVYSFQERKEKMVKEPNGEDENVDEMDEKDLIVKLLQLTAYEGVNEKKLRKIVKLAMKIMAEKD